MQSQETRVIVLKIFRFSDKSRAVQVENVNRNCQPSLLYDGDMDMFREFFANIFEGDLKEVLHIQS